MNPRISSDAFDAFFACAPLVIGVLIYLVFYIAKRHEGSESGAPPTLQTFACAQCGRRGSREQMVPLDHGGAIGWRCSQCAGQGALV